MPISLADIQDARNNHYPDAHIWKNLIAENPEYADAQRNGYPIEKAVSMLSSATPAFQENVGGPFQQAISNAASENVDRLKSMGSAFVQGSGLKGAYDVASGNEDYHSLEGAAKAAGDIGGASLIPLTAGKSAIMGGLTAAGLDATRIPQAIHAVEQPIEKWQSDHALPEVGARGQGWLKNTLARTGLASALNYAIPATTAAVETGVEMAPSILAGGPAAEATNNLYKGAANTVPAATQSLIGAGGTPPVSAYVPNGPVGLLPKALAKVPETVGKVDLISRTAVMNPQDMANSKAIEGYVKQNAPGGATEPTGFNTGEQVTGIMGKAYDKSKSNYQSMLNTASDAADKYYTENKVVGGYGPIAAQRLRDILKRPGFIPDEAKALINETANKVDDPKLTPMEYDAKIKEFNYNNKKLLKDSGANANTLDHFFGAANDALKQTHYEGLNQIQPGLGDSLKNTNFDYATDKGNLFGPFGKWVDGKPESIPDKILSSGQEFQIQGKKALDPETYSHLQDAAEGALFRKAVGGDGKIDGSKLETLFKKDYRGFDWRPDQAGRINTVIDMMKEAGVKSLQTENPSGTAGLAHRLREAAQLIPLTTGEAGFAMKSPEHWGAELAGIGGLAAYLKGAPLAARGLYNTAQQPITPLQSLAASLNAAR